MDSICLKDIRATPRHIVGRHEITYSVDAELSLDLGAAAQHDDLTQTVDYVQVARRIISLIEGLDVDLLESVAVRVADSILLSHQVRKVRVCVHRLSAPGQDAPNIGDVSVVVERESIRQGSVSAASVVSGQAVTYENNRPASGTNSTAPQLSPERSEAAEQLGEKTHKAVIAMNGSGKYIQNAMRSAIVSIDGVPGSQVVGISPLYCNTNDIFPLYKCAVLIVETQLEPIDLLSTLETIALAHTASDKTQSAAQVLDIYLVDLDDVEWTLEDMLRDRPQTFVGGKSQRYEAGLPYSDAWRRAEILKPWSSIDPQAHLGGQHGGSVSQLAQASPNAQDIELFSDSWILGGSV